MKMECGYLLVADAGGTKSDWYVLSDDLSAPLIVTTEGINASTHSDEHILKVIEELRDKLKEAGIALRKNESSLYFYGAGCRDAISESRVSSAVNKVFPEIFKTQFYGSDILGAARSLFGDKKGIVAILGTGSGSALYDGRNIVDSIPSLGYILGDEGSGAYLGRLLLNRYFKRDLSSDTSVLFKEEYGVEVSEVLERVYRHPSPNSYLASFVPFLQKEKGREDIYNLIYYGINQFFIRNINKYSLDSTVPIGFIGSVAFYFSDILHSVADAYNRQILKVVRQPIIGLGNYHREKLKI